MSAQDNIKIAQKMYDNFNRRNIEDSARYVSDNITLTNVPFGTTLKGKDGMKQALSIWSDTFSDAKVNVKNIIATDDCVITEFTGTGTHDGVLETPNGKIEPTNKIVNIPFVEVMHFKNGKATSSNLYYDTVTIIQQLGLTSNQGKSTLNSADNNKSAVEKFFSSFGKSEHNTYSETYFHKNHKFHFPLFPNTLGVEEHKKMDDDFVKGFPDLKVEIDDLFSSNDKVVLRGRLLGTHTGEFNKIPATGKKVDLSYIAIIRFENGKNAEEWVEMDTNKMLKQLGVGS